MSVETLSIAMFLLLIIFFFMGHPLAFVLGGVATIFGFFVVGPQIFNMFMVRTYGTMDNFVLVAITLFILMGNFLTVSGVADGLFESLRYLLGPVRGGLGLAVIAVCIVFAACTGIVGASVVTMGLLAGPMLLRYGYQKEITMGMIAAGGSLGILIPPSIMLVIMGDQASLSVGKLLLAAVAPGVLLGVLYMIYIAIRCFVDPKIGPPVPPDELAKVPVSKRITGSLIYALPPLALIFLVLGSIFFGVATPTEASGVGAFAAFVMLVAYGKFSWKTFANCIYSTAKATTMVVMILVGATCFTGVFLTMGGGQALIDGIMGMGLGKWGIYTLMMIILIILGMFIDWVGIVMITFPVFLPIAKTLGFDPVWFITIMAVNLQMSFLSPPFGYALFYLSGMGLEGIKLSHIYRGVVPFLALQLIGMILCTLYPQIILYLPNAMMK